MKKKSFLVEIAAALEKQDTFMKKNGLAVLIGFCVQFLPAKTAPFKLGVENISQQMITWLADRRIGLITNQTGRTQTGKFTVDILRDHGIAVQALLVPEHGINGTVLAERDVHDAMDTTRSLPIISLYGNGTGKHFSDEVTKNIDAFVFDIQDSGMRHYTYISTLFYAIEACARHNKSLVVLDRPNPLGRVVEGPLVDAHLKSFIAVAPIPLRHGMTVGELAHYFNKSCFNNKANVRVVPMSGYQDKKQQMEKCALNLSPNIQTLDACYGYSFLGLLGEIRPFDVGIATQWAFQCIMLPKDLNVSSTFWATLRISLAKHSIASTDFTYYSTRKKKQMVGLRIVINNIQAVSTCTLLADIITNARNHAIPLTFSKAFDTAIGSKLARPSFENPKAWACFMQSTKDAVRKFCKQTQNAYIYKPAPTCIAQQ